MSFPEREPLQSMQMEAYRKKLATLKSQKEKMTEILKV